MTKNHLKCISSPATWEISRREEVFVTRPNPGAHALSFGVPLSVVLKSYLGYAKTTREVKNILAHKTVQVDGVRRKDPRFIVGLMDLVEIKEAGEMFRMLIDARGKLYLSSVKKGDAEYKICKITGKSMLSGKVQVHLHDGRNILTDNKTYNTGDSLLVKVPGQEIKEHLPISSGSKVYLVGGKHKGEIKEVVSILGTKIMLKDDGGSFETLKKYAFVVGKDKLLLSLDH